MFIVAPSIDIMLLRSQESALTDHCNMIRNVTRLIYESSSKGGQELAVLIPPLKKVYRLGTWVTHV
jgi:hypothetical protein